MKNKRTKIISFKINPQGNLFDHHANIHPQTKMIKIFSLSTQPKKTSTYRRILALSEHLFENK